MQYWSSVILLVAVALALAEGGDPGIRERGWQSGPGIYDVDPHVMEDPFYQSYPNAGSEAIINAMVLAKQVKSVVDINGFQVIKNGRRIGILPSYYISFPKSGTSGTYSFLKNSLPCMVTKVKKEVDVVGNLIFQCSVEEGLIVSCDSTSVEDVVTQIVGQFDKGVKKVLKNPTCKDAFVFDGKAGTMFRALHIVRTENNERVEVPFDRATFIHALTPNARFIALARENDVAQLHSKFFFFNKRASIQQYRKALVRAQRALEEVGGMDSRCQGLLWDYPGGKAKGGRNPLMNSYGSSCNIQRFRILFGEQSVFITDAQSVVSCSDSILDWLSETEQVNKCSPVEQERERSSASYALDTKRAITSSIENMEQRLIGLLQNISYPLLKRNTGK
eukprot:CAMPEP_0181322660 /NCGR_PEP_ID=MMETSP1101-20121128/19347_1 /TAXON_ID=46948 /ORGANISM="Rhodomonas abbreviata, Strain Caron Lab Isolate" /LENGTH=390 /DNA_ID=CAMNT_0023430589 /DNA_START=128 /DNA_END=1300 /DNA_ORIENTATION=-